MTELRCSRPEETPRLKRTLWKLAFGDEDACIDFFLPGATDPEDMLVLLEDGVIVPPCSTLMPHYLSRPRIHRHRPLCLCPGHRPRRPAEGLWPAAAPLCGLPPAGPGRGLCDRGARRAKPA